MDPMRYVADLHLHSRYARATSRQLDFPALYRAALTKGVQLLGTGDFTHPGWMQELEQQLVPAEQGLFKLQDSLARTAAEGLPEACAGRCVRFALQVELSLIYKRDGRVRKNHNLVFMPSLDAARRFTARLGTLGNLASDGRPILGLDARDLLELVLETGPGAFLVPAHIWTPWFSTLGSMSGFDSLDECFRDLSPHVFAAETGLSSDPAMNWRVSSLDRITLVSNSDAHSPDKLGREANLFDTQLDYPSMHRALVTREGFQGTLEFFPEEGKYHLDGHRNCGVRLEPAQTRALNGKCPVCGGKLVVGVLSRVLELADRPSGVQPAGASPFRSLVSLGQVAGAALGVGSASRGATAIVRGLLSKLGPELEVLREAPVEDIEKVSGAVVAEAVRRVRAGELSIESGYDGAFGKVSIFRPEERAQLAGQPRRPRASTRTDAA
jgi:DNA helicase-2/ATP-dependent DNA helicase PcrA